MTGREPADNAASGSSNESMPTQSPVMRPPLDAQQLASLLDGRLDPHSRVEVLALLTASDSDREAFADAAAVLREIEESKPAIVRKRPLVPLVWLTAAAIAAIAIPALIARRSAPPTDDAGRLALSARIPAGWDASPWSSVRGGDAALSPASRAVRIGARITDLETAVRGGDTASARRTVADLAILGDSLPAPLVRALSELLAAADPAAAARVVMRQLPDSQYVNVGAWLEAARLAAASRDSIWLESDRTRVMVGRIEQLMSRSTQSRDALTRLRTALKRPAALDWGALEDSITELLRQFAS